MVYALHLIAERLRRVKSTANHLSRARASLTSAEGWNRRRWRTTLMIARWQGIAASLHDRVAEKYPERTFRTDPNMSVECSSCSCWSRQWTTTGRTSSAKSRLDRKTGAKVEKKGSRAPSTSQRRAVRRAIQESKSAVSSSISSLIKTWRRSGASTLRNGFANVCK